MRSPKDFQENDQKDVKTPAILENPRKFIYIGAFAGFAIGLIFGILMAFLSASGTKPPNFSSETMAEMTNSRSLFIICVSVGGFGIIGLGLVVLSWLAAKLQAGKS